MPVEGEVHVDGSLPAPGNREWNPSAEKPLNGSVDRDSYLNCAAPSDCDQIGHPVR